MKTMQVGELKAHFSKVMETVRRGQGVVISYGNKKENIAVIVPYAEFKKKNRIKLGLLKGKARIQFRDDFEMTSEELLGL